MPFLPTRPTAPGSPMMVRSPVELAFGNVNGFQKGTKKCDYVFHIGNEMIDIVQDCTYLGTPISSPGNFTLN